MASSSNPYQHYNQPHIEEDDLIDPDDGAYISYLGGFAGWRFAGWRFAG